MNILDLKKLMLVPLVCCTSMQQVNAEVKQDTTRQNGMKQYSRNEKGQTDWFKKEVRAIQEHNPNIDYSIRVAPLITRNDTTFQMGGVIAVFPKDKKPLFFQGAKRAGIPVIDNNPNSPANIGINRMTVLLKVDNNSHTERQLIQKALEKEINAGTFHIYTYEPPCCKNSQSNANFPCGNYYAELIQEYPDIEFHVYFDLARFKSLNKYYDFNTPEDLIWICKLISNINDYESKVLGKWNKMNFANELNIVKRICSNDEKAAHSLTVVQIRNTVDEIFRCLSKADLRNELAGPKHIEKIEDFYKNRIISLANHGNHRPKNLYIHIIQGGI